MSKYAPGYTGSMTTAGKPKKLGAVSPKPKPMAMAKKGMAMGGYADLSPMESVSADPNRPAYSTPAAGQGPRTPKPRTPKPRTPKPKPKGMVPAQAAPVRERATATGPSPMGMAKGGMAKKGMAKGGMAKGCK